MIQFRNTVVDGTSWKDHGSVRQIQNYWTVNSKNCEICTLAIAHNAKNKLFFFSTGIFDSKVSISSFHESYTL